MPRLFFLLWFLFTVLIDLYHRVLVSNLIGYIVRFKKFFPLEGIRLQIMLRYYLIIASPIIRVGNKVIIATTLRTNLNYPVTSQSQLSRAM